MKREVILVSPRGFCAGVDRAIEIVDIALEVHGTPLYVKHEIVHNKHVVSSFIKKGVKFIEDLNDVPIGKTIIFSAHGVAPDVIKKAEERKLKIIDATCPLVTKVHLEAKRFAKNNYRIFLIGHKNHVEAIGTYGEAPNQIEIIESVEDVQKLEIGSQATSYLTQTTLSLTDTAGIIRALQEKFPDIEGPSKSDICYATTNRQEAISSIAQEVDLILVIGSKNSSNSNRLRELSLQLGTKAYLIDDAKEIDASWFENVSKIGLTSGASAPESLVQSVLQYLKEHFQVTAITEKVLKKEDVSFKLPKSLMVKDN